MKRRILAMLLALVMVLGMLPVQALAEEVEPMAADAVSELMEETEAPVEETEAPVEETEPLTEEAEPLLEETEVPDEEPAVLLEESEPEGIAPEGDAAASVTVYVTVNDRGVLATTSDGEAMVNRAVTVTDVNGDGVLTYDEAMLAAHDAYCPDGYATDGTTVVKLWGVEQKFYYFINNNVAASSDSTVAEGDKLYASVLKETSYGADYYTYFTDETKTVQVGEEFTLTLMGYGACADPQTPAAVKNISVGTWNDGEFTVIEGKTTDTSGQVTLSFDEPGTYCVTGSGTVYYGFLNWDIFGYTYVWAPTMAPCCVVTVETPKTVKTAEVSITVSYEGVLAKGNDGSVMVERPVTVKDLNDDDILTYDEALIAAHAAYCPEGYATTGGAYGLQVTKLWGKDTSNTLFFKNGVPLRMNVGDTEASTIDTADKLYASVNADDTYYSDWYTGFEPTALTVEAGQEFTLNLSGCLGMSGGETPAAVSGVSAGTWDDGKFVPLEGKQTDENGNVTLSLPNVGTYYVTAKGTVATEVTDWGGAPDGSGNYPTVTVDAPIMAPYCVVTITLPKPKITAQPVGASYMVGESAKPLTVEAAGMGTLTYQWYSSGDETALGAPISGATEASYTPDTYAISTRYYTCVVTDTIGQQSASAQSEAAKVAVMTVEDIVRELLSGSGTEADPWLVQDAQDYQDVYDLVARGVSFKGQFLRQTADITLPEDWQSIGVLKNPETGYIQGGDNVLAFRGTLDGGDFTVTVPYEGHPLFGYVWGATIRNLNIYGEKIAGYGLVDNLEGVYKDDYYHWAENKVPIVIENVTLKSGSSTLKSGFIGTCLTPDDPYVGCRGEITVTIRGCTVEEGVVIGYNKDQSMIGSFAGRFNGTIDNCVSYATVYGTDYVGGIVGSRDNYNEGVCLVTNSEFAGTVEASGTHAGGIAGGGYSQPIGYNGRKADVTGCYVSGNVTGADKVGGIIGGESFVVQGKPSSKYYTYKHEVQNNAFTGTVSATSGTYVGGIIGYDFSLNVADLIEGNTCSADCGAARGIGYVEYLDTSHTSPDTSFVGHRINSADYDIYHEPCPEHLQGDDFYFSWYTRRNRTDDPLGADADKLCSMPQSLVKPVIITQPVGASYIQGDTAKALTVVAEGTGELSYQWYASGSEAVLGTPISDATAASYTPDVSEIGTSYYTCVVSVTVNGAAAATRSDTVAITVKTVEQGIADVLDGAGTADAPYLIQDAQDYQDVYDLVARGVSFDGMYLEQTADITLPEDWQSIGVLIDPPVGHINNGANMAAFSGTLNGGGNTVTVPEGGHPLLGYVKGAAVKNLNIYGRRIAGYGLVDHYEGVNLHGNAITIDNVTLKSGSSTLKSGLIGTYITNSIYAGCSSDFVVTIRDCTIEADVVIGYDKNESHIGSFAGRFNGTIENCVSYATVYGKDYVGGIAGGRDNSMGTCAISNCTFDGTVKASGQHVGGILGGGYNDASAYNGYKVDVVGCSASGTVTGANKVGGIVGGDSVVIQLVSYCPDNRIQNNQFTGRVESTDGTYVGGIIGYCFGLNRKDILSDNFCSTARSIGFVEYLDTNYPNPDLTNVGHWINTENGTDDLPDPNLGKWFSWQAGFNRTDDPLGTDAGTLCTSTNAVLARGTASELVGGKSLTMKVLDSATGKAVRSNEIHWYLENPDDAAYASISASGALKTYPVATQHSVTLICALSGSHTGRIKHTVTIYPAATQLEIWNSGGNATGKTLYLNAAEGSKLDLTGTLYPTDAKKGITWKSSDARIAAVTDGVVSYAGRKGTVIITATAQDGSGKRATVKIQVGILTEKVEITKPESTTLRSGKSLTLKAVTTPEKPTVSGVTFTLVNAADSAYAMVIPSGRVIAKTVNEPHAVPIKATSKDAAQIESDPITLTILPKSAEMLILKSGDAYVTGTTQVRNVEDTIALSAFVLDTDSNQPQEVAQTVTWKSSNPNVASIAENGMVTCVKAGRAAITAVASDGSKAVVTIKVTNLVDGINIKTMNAKDDFVIASGKSVALRAIVSPAAASNKSVTWTISDGAAYAKLSSSGVLIANKDLTSPVTVTVTATARDGSGVQASQDVTIKPLSQGIRILRDVSNDDGSITKEPTNTTLVWDMVQNAQLKLYAWVYPRTAEERVTWSSSNPRVASIAADGTVTCHRAGTVIITATASDGSGKRAVFKLSVVKRMTGLTLEGGVIAGGKSLAVKNVIEPADTTNKKLIWTITENTAGAKVSSSGKLTTRAVTKPEKVTITAEAQDGSGLTASCDVTIYPATTKIVITDENGAAVPGTLAAGAELKLAAASTPKNAANVYTWKSNNPEVTVKDGTVAASEKAVGKKVTITCTAADGTGKSASVTIKIVAAEVNN